MDKAEEQLTVTAVGQKAGDVWLHLPGRVKGEAVFRPYGVAAAKRRTSGDAVEGRSDPFDKDVDGLLRGAAGQTGSGARGTRYCALLGYR